VNAFSAIPEAKGLFNPENDKDACGVGFVAQLSKGASRAVVTDALKMLARMAHRGACGCEENTGTLMPLLRCYKPGHMVTIT
jgi:glutamate synthase (NADPH/NADH)